MTPERLWQEVQRVDFAHLPFVHAVEAGSCPREVLGDYAMDLAALAAGFPQLLGAMLSRCDLPAARRILTDNLIEEEGHATMARELARTFGVPDSRPLPVINDGWIQQELQAGRWLGPLAFASVGHEASVPVVFGRLVPALIEHYGYTPDQLRYLRLHVDADAEHGADAVAVIAAAATTPALEAEALRGARRGVTAWYHLHRRHAARARHAKRSDLPAARP